MTDEVNEIENDEEQVLNYYKLNFSYEQPRTGFVFVAAPDADRAAELIFDAVPDELKATFQVTAIEEVDEDTVAQSVIPTELDTIH